MRFISATQTKQKLSFEAEVSRETNAVKTMSAIAIILIVNCLVPSLEAKDIIRDKSPDGKFALRITKEDVFPACEEKPVEKNSDDKYVKALEATTRPVEWLHSGELVLAEHSESLMESGATRACGQTITIAFDSDHKASVKSAR